MVDDIDDFRNTMNTLRIVEGSVSEITDDAYGAALGLINWSELSRLGQMAWRWAPTTITAPQASFFFSRLEQLHQDAYERNGGRYIHPWSLTDPDFLFCFYYIKFGDPVAPREFQQRYLRNLRRVNVTAVRTTLSKRTSDFLLKVNPTKINPRDFYEESDPKRTNLLSDVDWSEVQRLLQNGPLDLLKQWYATDEVRRNHLAQTGMSAYSPIRPN